MTKKQQMQVVKLHEQQGIQPTTKHTSIVARIAALEAKLRISTQPKGVKSRKPRERLPKNRHGGESDGILWWLIRHQAQSARNPGDSYVCQQGKLTWVVLMIMKVWSVPVWNSLLKSSQQSCSSQNLNRVIITCRYMCCSWPLSCSTLSPHECLCIQSWSRIEVCPHSRCHHSLYNTWDRLSCYLLNQPGNWDKGPWSSP